MAVGGIPDMTQVSVTFDDNFLDVFNLELGPVLGTGMSGAVFQATSKTDPAFHRALKVFRFDSPEEEVKKREMYEKEMTLMTKFHHPNVMKLDMAAECEDYFLLCMEYYPFGSLSEYVDLLPSELVDYFFIQTACALRYLHSQQIAHCDVKLGNILVDPESNAILTDFGLAVSVPPGETTVPLSSVGGTRAYRGPEIEGKGPDFQVNPFKLDVYALGVVLWGLVFQVKPKTEYKYLEMVSEVSDMPPLYKYCLETMLEPDPAKRISLDSLLEVLKGHQVWGGLVHQV